MVNAADLKSAIAKAICGFESRPRHLALRRVPSKLYGKMGELWKSYGRRIDPSWAGYRNGSWSVENIPTTSLCRPDLHENLLARRRAGL